MAAVTAEERAAGLVQRTRARSTGTVIEVWRPDTLVDDPGWVIVCEHGNSCHHETRVLAVSWSVEPQEWCETGCRAAWNTLNPDKAPMVVADHWDEEDPR